MSFYKDDRSFTNYVHEELAIPKIYKPLGWTVKNTKEDELYNLDINHGIDYILSDQNNKIIRVQERFLLFKALFLQF